MSVIRMDNVGIVVADLDAAVVFFTELGLVLEGRSRADGEWAGRVTGLRGQRVEIAMMKTPDGHSRLELSRFDAPAIASDHRTAGGTVANILLSMFIIAIASAWRRSGYWIPWAPAAAPSRGRVLLIAGGLIALLTTGFSLGDIVGGRTQISKDPVRYASRLTGTDAHHHDLLDSTRYWGQIALQAVVGLMVAGSLVLLSRPARTLHSSPS